MPLYTYSHPGCPSFDRVRPIGTDWAECPTCGNDDARRHHINHFDVVGPTVDTRGMSRRFVEAVAEREHIYETAEQRSGMTIERPDDWAIPEARAAEKLRRGEVDTAVLKRTTEYHVERDVSL